MGSGAEEWGPVPPAGLGPREAAPRAARMAEALYGFSPWPFPGCTALFRSRLALYLTRSSAPRIKQYRVIALTDSGQ